MEFNLIKENDTLISELLSDEVCLNTAEDALDLMAACGARILLVYVRQIIPDFFRLPTGLLGEVLQKFTNYRMKLAVVGDISPYMTKNFADFIRESNTTGDFLFLPTREEAIARLAG
jgi:hypothetical protein